MRKTIILMLLAIFIVMAKAQQVIQGYIISIEDNKVYLDVTSPKVVVGDVLSVYSDAGYIIHPVTKKKIKKEGSIIADLEIIEVNNDYSVATIYPEDAIKKLKLGMTAQMPELTREMKEAIEKEQEAELANEAELVFDNPENFTTAEQVIQWHLKSTGLDKMAANPPRSYLIETKATTINKKGKTVSVTHITRIVDIMSSSVYTKADVTLVVALKNLEVSSSSVVSNGIGWLKEGKKKAKPLDNYRIKEIIGGIDIIKDFTCKGYTCTLYGDLVVDGKSCFELVFSNNVKSCIDKNTGLIVAKSSVGEFRKIGILSTKVEKSLAMEKVIAYRQFGDYMLPSMTQTELDNGFLVKTEILQFVSNYPVKDSQFTKEALSGIK